MGNQIGVLCGITKTNEKQYNEYFFAHSTHLHHKMRIYFPGGAFSDKAGIEKCY